MKLVFLFLQLSLSKATERMVAHALENPESPKIEGYKRKYEQVQKRIACLEALVVSNSSHSYYYCIYFLFISELKKKKSLLYQWTSIALCMLLFAS